MVDVACINAYVIYIMYISVLCSQLTCFLPYSPDNMGLLDPATSDGRVIFFLPWEKMTIAGTTDTPTTVTAHPIPMEEDINFILSEVRNYLSSDVEGMNCTER